MVVGGVDSSGTRGEYGQGLAAQLTVSAVGTVACASRRGAHLHGKELPLVSAFQCKYHLTSDIIGHGHLAAPAVAGLAAYLMSLDQYRVQLLVPDLLRGT